jgi:hypothetical protein
VNNCLRRILHIYWPKKISNQELWDKTQQIPVDEEIQTRRWRWLGHTLRKPADSITRQAITWNPPGKRKRGRPRNTWRRQLDLEASQLGKTMPELTSLANNRQAWCALICGLRRGLRKELFDNKYLYL